MSTGGTVTRNRRATRSRDTVTPTVTPHGHVTRSRYTVTLHGHATRSRYMVTPLSRDMWSSSMLHTLSI
eukprot:878146-Amorphochlora_amoeboformis.AAC.1